VTWSVVDIWNQKVPSRCIEDKFIGLILYMVWSEVVLVHLKFLCYFFLRIIIIYLFRQSFLQVRTSLKPCETCVAVHCEAGARRPNCLHQWLHGIWRPTPAWSSLVYMGDMTLLHTLIFFFYPISVWELCIWTIVGFLGMSSWELTTRCSTSATTGLASRNLHEECGSTLLFMKTSYLLGMCSFSIRYVQTVRCK